MVRSRLFALAFAPALLSCRDLSQFSTRPGTHFEGIVVGDAFVRRGFPAGAKLCVTLDADKLQTDPGTIGSSDGTLPVGTTLLPLPAVMNDPLSQLSLGEGRENTTLLAAQSGTGQALLITLSLVNEGSIEVRVLGGAISQTDGMSLFGVFSLSRKEGPCVF